MNILGKLVFSRDKPLYLQLAEALSVCIREGKITSWEKLPPEREMAKMLGVSRTTVINAYRQLEESQLVVTKVGSGTYVAGGGSGHEARSLAELPWQQLFSPRLKTPMASILREILDSPTGPDKISLAAGMPDPAYYPVEIFSSILGEGLREIQPEDLGYLPTEGYLPFRQAIAKWETSQGRKTGYENVLIASGSQQSIDLISRTFVEPGDHVIIEAPSYIGAIQIFQAGGARLLSLSRDGGFPFATFEDYLVRYRPKLFYTIPTFHNPTGYVMTLAERQEILRLAEKYRLVIIEDDPYSKLSYGGTVPPSLRELDKNGVVVYLGTFSKILFPGLRTGWVNAAPPVIQRLAEEKQYTDLHCNNIMQWALCQYLQRGVLEAHLTKMRAMYSQRRTAMVDALAELSMADISFSVPEGGFYCWCRLRRGQSARVLMQEAGKLGIGIVPGEAFYGGQGGEDEFRLCFATHEPALLREGVRRLARIIQTLPVVGDYGSYRTRIPLT